MWSTRLVSREPSSTLRPDTGSDGDAVKARLRDLGSTTYCSQKWTKLKTLDPKSPKQEEENE